MPTACPLRNWEDRLLPRSSRRPSLVQDWLGASTIWSLPSLTKIRPYMVAGESCSWRATMTAQQRRLVRLRKISVSRRSNLAGFRKVDCLCKVAVLSTFERMNQAAANKISTTMSAIVSGGPKVATIGRNEAAAGIAKAFGASPEDAKATFLKRTTDVRALALDPQQLQDRLTQQTNDWHEHAPQTAQALQIAPA